MEEAITIVVGPRVYRPLMDDTVTAEDWAKARYELDETEEMRTECLDSFRELLEEETEFIPQTDDSFLIRFLRVRKFDLERAYDCLRNYYVFRATNPSCFPAPSMLERVWRANIFNYLPHRDHMGRAIAIIKMGNWNVHSVSFDDFIAAGNILAEYVLENPVTQINGYICIVDFSGCTNIHMLPLTSPRNMILLLNLMQNRFPGRLKKMYWINCQLFVRMVFYRLFIRCVEPSKLKDRIMILRDVRLLHEIVDPPILPTEYGGNMPPTTAVELVQRVLDNEAHMNFSFG